MAVSALEEQVGEEDAFSSQEASGARWEWRTLCIHRIRLPSRLSLGRKEFEKAGSNSG